MATDKVESKHMPTSYEFDCEPVPVPPGTKTRARLPRDGEPAPLPGQVWWIVGVSAVAAFILGVLIGRLVL